MNIFAIIVPLSIIIISGGIYTITRFIKKIEKHEEVGDISKAEFQKGKREYIIFGGVIIIVIVVIMSTLVVLLI